MPRDMARSTAFMAHIRGPGGPLATAVTRSVVLRKDGKSVALEVAATCDPPLAAPVTWPVEGAKPPTPRETQNEGFRILSCTAPRAKRGIEVTIRPER
ncbi:MAG: hypothetical protein ACKOZU_03665 [Planctomycetaceae bacterium]